MLYQRRVAANTETPKYYRKASALEANPTPAFRLGRGNVVAGYKLLRCLGRGWESTNYLAAEQHSGAIRRLKFYRGHEPDNLELLGHIATIFERFHPTTAVPTYHHMGVWQRNRREIIPFLVFGYIEGKPLNGLLHPRRWHRRWTDVTGLQVLAAIAWKLAAVHDLGYAVGEFPDGVNILVTRDWEPLWCDLDPGFPGEPNEDQPGDLEQFFTILDALAEHKPASRLVARAVKRLGRMRSRSFRASTMREIAERLDALLDAPDG